VFGNLAVAVGRAIHRRVVQEHQRLVAGQLHIELDHVRAEPDSFLKRRQGVFQSVLITPRCAQNPRSGIAGSAAADSRGQATLATLAALVARSWRRVMPEGNVLGVIFFVVVPFLEVRSK
jgi:hypothetical protein